MNTEVCKNCKHYKATPTAHDPLRGLCSLSDLTYDETITKLSQLIFTDYEGYQAYLYVGPEFGCVHWSAK